MPIRRSLALLATAGLLPIVALGATFGIVTLRGQRQALHEKAQMDARFAAALLAGKLEDSRRAVEMVAQSPAFDGPAGTPIDTVRFRALATRLIAYQPEWKTISVADAAGRRLVDVPVAIGGRQGGQVVEPASLRRVVAERRPTIGDVVRGPKGGLAFAVRAPVVRDGKLRWVVSAVVTAERLRDLLLFQPLPDGWAAWVTDSAGTIVVGSAGEDKPGPAAGGGGFALAGTVDTPAMVAGTGWVVHVTMPVADIWLPKRNALLLFAGAIVVCLLLVGLLAWLLSQDIRQLRRQESATRQSQRLEVLGQLTGGVAHDFNNLLTPIIGGLDLALHRVADPRLRMHLESAATSADRARSLVARLLAFARRQPLSPKPIDLATLLGGMADLIEKSLALGIDLTLSVADDLPPVFADAAQLELAILNLAINARDAMPGGGRLRIAATPASREDAAGLPAGPYLAIVVADDGGGMDERTLKQAIEPFFTTKSAGKGTGLGLSMVHGFAAQSGGALRLASRPGDGTTATILLPASANAVPAAPPPASDPAPAPGRLLLVDDDERVRRSTAAMLRDHGQTVVEAASVDEALARLAEDGTADRPFDAIVTDFAMPGRSGGDLIAAVRADRPDLPILLITGFIAAAGSMPGDVPTLMKPFRPAELLAALAAARAGHGVALPVG